MSTDVYTERVETQAGNFAVAVDENGSLLRVAFLDDDRKPGCVQSWDATLEALDRRGCKISQDTARTAAAVRELRDYVEGRRESFSLSLAPQGTKFQQEVWRMLREIPRGEIRTYSGLAQAAGRPKAARAVGRAVATNPIPIAIPCHRVLGADGSLTGFAGGLALKKRLLEIEGFTPGNRPT